MNSSMEMHGNETWTKTQLVQVIVFVGFLVYMFESLKKNSIAAFPTGYIQYWFIFWRCTDGVGHGVGSIFGAPKMGYVGYVSLKMDKKK